MSITKIWNTRALQSHARFVATHEMHLYLQMDTHSPSHGLHGVYCRTPALDGFDYNEVLDWYHVDFRGQDGGVRYAASGTGCFHREVTCQACVYVWTSFLYWLHTTGADRRRELVERTVRDLKVATLEETLKPMPFKRLLPMPPLKKLK